MLHTRHFASLSELAALLAAHKAGAGLKRSRNREHIVSACERNGAPDRDWFGLRDADAVDRAIERGYDDGAKLIDAAYDSVKAKLPASISIARQRRRAEQGDDLDIHAVLAGNLSQAWTRCHRTARMGNGIIRIACDTAGNFGCTMDTLQWRGVAALALARVLLDAKYSVEIVAGMAVSAVWFNGGQEHDVCITATVKARHERPDARMLAAACLVPGFFRRYLLAAMLRICDDDGGDATRNLGHAASLERVLPVNPVVATVVTPSSIMSREQALAWVIKSHAFLQQVSIRAERA